MTQPAGGKHHDNPAVADVTDVESRAVPASAATAPDSERVSRAVRGRAPTRAEWERREYLGIDQFAFFRGYLERLPLDKLADQYLETGLDLRMARSTLLWIQERLVAGARRAQDYRGRCQLRDVVEADARIDSDSKSMRRSLGNVGEFTPLSKVHRELFAIKPRAQQMAFECEVLPDWPEA
ncbi:hypothetical protein AB870_25235 (plasmid) [Pandoraea faecigallinarum]|uniref:Uncharacterized protein n=1 Tax=Pandoraea faecigallinarum TaxID=656179 RepID=A0A0H3X402_9BURK|nr:hypothetical protein AB870_25235 [Pandoraea faecigallinarum]